MANVYVGESKALVFPVMSEGYLKMEYDDSNTTDSKGNLWKLSESFVVEAIITPYDVNGNASAEVTTSTKTVPTGTSNSTQSGTYFGVNRHSHKMMIFYNEYFRLYLENTTSHNKNQPAEYKIVAYIADITSGSPVYTTVQSNAVIKPINTLHGYVNTTSADTKLEAYYEGISTNKTLLQADTSKSGNTITFPASSSNDWLGNTSVAKLAVGSEIFNDSGVSLGTVASTPSLNTITVADASNHTAKIYVSQPKEAFYVEQTFKISCVYNVGGSVNIYLNNQILKMYSYSSSPTFAFKADDCFIGQDGSNKNTQFMGELYEIAMFKGRKPSPTINTLSPSYSNILFYYSFGE
tara:strand:- start:7569 stop:8621 length:1053 start_codon:yes stop_codon:yes gene_type:complete